MIKSEGLSKRYFIGTREPYTTVRDAIVKMILEPFRRIRNFGASSSNEKNTIWALKDIWFEVNQGQVLGLIGHNGAGKSTLLKLLSRICEPTEGRATLRGTVVSLLEIGTGFHPELTGRENIFLSGAILGVRRQEIRCCFDEIVDFSGVEKFIDTPLKRYSSGMRVRLGFAVAAHLDPEILLVDEVLAVGDADFQRKCIKKMSKVSKEGRTIMFVSHNMSAILNLCPTSILLNNGKIVYQGDSKTAVQKYLLSSSQQGENLSRHRGRPAGMKPIIQSLSIRSNNSSRGIENVVHTGQDAMIKIGYDTETTVDYVLIDVLNELGQRLFSFGTHLDSDFKAVLQGKGTIQCLLPSLCLSEGSFSLTVAMGTNPGGNLDLIEEALWFRVELNDYFVTDDGLLSNLGHIAQRCNWSLGDGHADPQIEIKAR